MDKYQEVIQHRSDEKISENEIRVTMQTPVRSYITYATNKFAEKKGVEVVLRAMGRAINKTVTIAEILKRRVPGLHQITKIDSTDIKSVWEPLEEGLDRVETTRHVSAVAITLSQSPLDTKNPGYQAPIPEDQVKQIPLGGHHPSSAPGQPFIEGSDSRGRGRGRGRGGRGGRGGRRGGPRNGLGSDDQQGQQIQGQPQQAGHFNRGHFSQQQQQQPGDHHQQSNDFAPRGRGGFRGGRGGRGGFRGVPRDAGSNPQSSHHQQGQQGQQPQQPQQPHHQSTDSGFRGGRGGYRGSAPRGNFHSSPRGAPRGTFRGGRGRGGRGDFQGGAPTQQQHQQQQ